MNTALFMLRAIQCGISIKDLELLSIGMVIDIFVESMNDEYKYNYKSNEKIATQSDIDRL